MPGLLVCYHFFHPNSVVSARMFTQLAEEQARRGWSVTALTSNRAFDDPRVRYPSRETVGSVEVVRVPRPPLDQSRPLPRLANSAWMIGAWALRAPTLPAFDAAIIGSDPAFAALLAVPLRALRPCAAIFHWCFDVYPEAIEAEGIAAELGPGGRVAVGATKALMSAAYRSCTAVVDIGSCMRERLARYPGVRAHETLTPWALSEPLDSTDAAESAPHPALPGLRARLFPRARLALLYAGSMGRAHEFRALLALARACRARSGDDVGFCFVATGNRFEDLRAQVTSADTNVHFAPFASEEELAERLDAADLHLVSLKPEWVGLVVPSKFFAALAAGRPVLFAGPRSSAIAAWIAEHDVGLVLDAGDDGTNLAGTVEALHALMAEPGRLAAWQRRARDIYKTRFSKHVINDRWDRLLRTNVSNYK